MRTNNDELIGKTLGTFTLQRLLGRGGMGAVYLAQQTRPRRIVAVKVLLPDLVEQRPRDEFLARFRREADAIAALDHVNIMPIYEYGEQGDTAYLVMPYVTGGTLREKLEKQGQLPLKEVLNIVEQAAAGLESAHSKGIVHRDLKPGNILFHADGRVLIADFGLAKVLKDVTDESNGRFLTSVGTIVGTPEYLSPEQGTGSALDQRTDVYSLGIVIFHMLAGQVPFTGASPVAVAIKHALEAPPSLIELNPGIPPAVEAVVHQAMAKSPDQRFSSANELARALRNAITTTLEGYKAPPTTVSGSDYEAIDHSKATPSERVTPQEQPPFTTELDNSSPIAEDHPLPRHIAAQQKQVQAIPTVLMNEDASLHSSETEAAPRLQTAREKLTTHPTMITDPRATVVKPREVPNPSQEGEVRRFEQVASPAPRIQPRARAGCQSASMMLVGSILTLILVAGALAAYLHYGVSDRTATTNQHNGTPQTQKTPQSTPQVTRSSTPTTPLSQEPSGLPAPTTNGAQVFVGTIGSMLYGTSLPGGTCDKQGGTWSQKQNATLQCTSNGTVLHNTANNTLAGTFLSNLPQQQKIPENFVLQVQVTVNPGSHGQFGVYFHNQPGEQNQGAYSYLVNPEARTSQTYTYADDTGSARGLSTSYPFNPPQTDSSTITIEVIVSNGVYNCYINQNWQGYATSDQYKGGDIGLAADAGTNVTFKNLAIYTLN
ncbi:serine/threonine-protein kinase [Tengunoibacter tsumagoiensis]|uniref:non-specific serine/threonine protein kinase n=1 Tax=Tengunoibacter tsumagoiensis TaxID=2014871 RepID=A0A402A0X7_9CHLR|nr:serine/threonine-protein kinase [Tengunoibacter tsumagoiensis]GCE12712.1 hypothetical protein KTT_25710 [Tengunoibacter tsumagoiensis]